MSEDNGENFFTELRNYKLAIESLRPIKRPMLLWSVVSLVYVCGGLYLKVDAAALWGFQITGITGGKLTSFLFLATSYYTIKWLWSNFLKLRPYWREGFIRELWKHLIDAQRAEKAGEAWHFKEGFLEVQHTDNDLTMDKDFRGTVSDLINFGIVSRVVKFMEPFGLPLAFPFLVALLAIIALLIRFLS